jgi:hypothetical protein
MGMYEADFEKKVLGEIKHIKETFHIVRFAQFWEHQWVTTSAVGNTGFVLNYTKDWLNHPDPEARETFQKIPGTWVNRCITSRELTFEDTGLKNSNCESVWVAKER